ncbi:MAG TPA: hypothetical protein VNX25_05715 [Verrucomicrobiae bacterium]|nr:hypothetical protein [Verrucomicrobiae bacterium]
MIKRIVAAACLATMTAAPALALDQAAFRTASKELGAALSFHKVAPAAPLGITGFDAGAEVSLIRVDDAALAEVLDEAGVPSNLYMPRLRARKGLPFGIDVGAMYAYAPETDIRVIGAEVSKALLEGGIATPALSVRGSYTRLTGVDQLHLQTVGVDASISKGFVIVTPYAGGGMTYVHSDPKGDLAGAVGEEKIWQPRVFAGVQLVPFPLFRLTADVEYSQRFIYTLKAGIGF